MATQKISEMTEAVILQDEDYAPIIQSDLNKKIKIELLRDYNKLHNKPALNGVTIENNKNLADYNVTQANQGIKINDNTKQTLELETLTATEMEQRAEVNKAVTVATADKMAKETAHQIMSKDYLPNSQNNLVEGENQPVSYKAVKDYVDTLERKVDANEEDIENKHAALESKVDENERDIEEKLSALEQKTSEKDSQLQELIEQNTTDIENNKTEIEALKQEDEKINQKNNEQDENLNNLKGQGDLVYDAILSGGFKNSGNYYSGSASKFGIKIVKINGAYRDNSGSIEQPVDPDFVNITAFYTNSIAENLTEPEYTFNVSLILRALPDGTKDYWENGIIYRNIGYIESYNSEVVGDNWLSNTGQLSTGAKVFYKLEEVQKEELDIDILTSWYPYSNAWHNSELETSIDWLILIGVETSATGDGVPKYSNLLYRENEPLPDGYQFTDSLIPSTLIEMGSGDVLENTVITMNGATESLKTRVQGIENTIAANPINVVQNHNNIYRGADLLSKYTLTKIHEMIEDGSFRDIYIGDYFDITISTPMLTTKSQKVRCIIAGLDTYLRTGDTELTKHHAVIVTKDCMKDSAKMNSTNITTGGYIGSEMYKNIIPVYDTAFTSALTVEGTSYLLSYRDIFSNSVNNNVFSMGGADLKGGSNNFSWRDTKTTLLSEQEVFGSTVWSSSGYDVGIGYRQLPLFRLNPLLIIANYSYDNPSSTWYWLRNVAFSSSFANVYRSGIASDIYADYDGGVRLRFLLS